MATVIFTLSLHDALPISSVEQRGKYPAPDSLCSVCARHAWTRGLRGAAGLVAGRVPGGALPAVADPDPLRRSEEHTSELQSRGHLVCRLLLEKKKIHTST